MSDPVEPTTQPLGQAGETCRGCGAPLAVDQRYCLNCGQRRSGPRVDYRPHLNGSAQAAAARNGSAPAPEAANREEDGKPSRDYTPLAAVGGIAVLGLMLLVGVLIGKGDGSSQSAAPAPVVVQGGTAEKTEADTSTGSAKPKQKAAKSEATGAKSPTKKADSAGSLTAGDKGGGPVEASDDALKELEESPDYSKESAKLPDEIATGGAPPPKDSKAPGGGSKGTAIE